MLDKGKCLKCNANKSDVSSDLPDCNVNLSSICILSTYNIITKKC